MTGASSRPRIDERITERYAALSPQERRAAETLLEHLDDLATYRSAELADLAGVSKATMSRLFRSLGFADFDEVRDHLRGAAVGRRAAPGRRGADDLARHLEHERRVAARRAREPRARRRSSRCWPAARRVLVVGWRNSHPVALHLRQQLDPGARRRHASHRCRAR